MPRIRVLALVYALLLSPLALAAAPTSALPGGMTRVTSAEGITEYALPNGLHVVTLADPSKPTTTINMTVKVGSRFEGYGETGMAHLLEHMMFKGTPHHGPVMAEFSNRGLQANGSTTYDRTNYFASMAHDDANIDWYMHWLSDALVNSYIARKDLDSEMTVVRNEMESGENNPGNILYQNMLAISYHWHSYGKATIGSRSDVENVNIPHLQAFYHKYYQPDNVVLIVTGKFDEEKMLALIASTFGKIPRPKRTLEATYTLDPAQDGERSVTLRRVGDTPLVFTMYHIPAGSSPEYASAVLAGIVLGGDSLRLHKALVETKLAASAFGSARSLAEPGVIFFGAELKSDQSSDVVRDTLVSTVEGIGKEPITAAELERAKNIWLRGFDQTLNDPQRLGVTMSDFVALGDWRLLLLRRDQVKAVTLEDINQFAKAYLLQSNRTVGIFVPTVDPIRAPAPVRVDVAAVMKGFKSEVAVEAGEAFDASTENIAQRTQTGTLSNGMQFAFLTKKTRGGKVNLTFKINLGEEKSLFGHEAAGDAVAAMLNHGTDTLSREALAAAFEKLQTAWSVEGGATGITVTLVTTRENLDRSMDLVADALRHPKFDAAEFEQVRAEWITGLEQARSDPEALVSERIGSYGNPYPKGDIRYVYTSDESIENVHALKIEDVTAFYQKFYGATGAIVSAVGDFDAPGLKDKVTKLFGDWVTPTPFVRVPMPYTAQVPTVIRIDAKDKQNATMIGRIEFPLRAEDREYQALNIATQLIGSSSGRFWHRIRETQGLSYNVGADLAGGQFNDNATWEIFAIFAPQNGEKVRIAFNEELARIRKDGATADEVRLAKEAIRNTGQLARAQDNRLAPLFVNLAERQKKLTYLTEIQKMRDTITTDEVNAAIRKYLDPDKLVLVEAGDFTSTPK